MKRAVLFAAILAACSHQPRSTAEDDSTPKKGDDPPGMEDVQIKTIAVAGSVHMLVGRGGNIGVSAGADGKLIIDDQFEPLAPKIREAVDALGGGALRFVINTHFHGDHTGGNPVFGKDATIIAHTNVRKRLSAENKPAVALPVITFAESVTLHFNGEDVRVIHLPTGHTDGDSVIHFTESNVIHMGDHYFNGRFPYVDLGSGGDVVAYAANVAKVIEMGPPDAKVIPGHGELSNMKELEAFHAMLQATIGEVREQMKAGKKPDQMKLDPKWKSWGTGFIKTDKWIATIYRSLSR